MSARFEASTLLPPDARKALIAAARKPESERQIAIEEATERVKRKYPQFFKVEQENSNESETQ